MQTYKDYRNARQKAVDTIAGVEEQLRILGGSAKAKILKVARNRLLSNDFRIIFCGEFKRGKSTLINAMLGNKVLPMKVAPCTGVITEVKFDGLPRVQVHPEEGETFVRWAFHNRAHHLVEHLCPIRCRPPSIVQAVRVWP